MVSPEFTRIQNVNYQWIQTGYQFPAWIHLNKHTLKERKTCAWLFQNQIETNEEKIRRLIFNKVLLKLLLGKTLLKEFN